MKDYSILHCILISQGRLTSFAKQALQSALSKNYVVEQFYESELARNITHHEKVPYYKKSIKRLKIK